MAGLSSLGMGSGFELAGMLEQLRAVDEEQVNIVKAKQERAEEQLTEIDVVKSKVLAMKSHALELSLNSAFMEVDVSVSDEDALTAEVLVGTAESVNQVEVMGRALRSSFQSGGVADTEAIVSVVDTTFSYHIGVGGDTIDVSVSADMTISELADAINDDENNPGVTASVIDDGSGTDSYRLVLLANDSGEDNRIFMDNQLPDLLLFEAQGSGGVSLNSEFEVNGINYQRQTNDDIDDVIQGVTLNLQGIGSSTVNIEANTESIRSEIMGLIETFNELTQEITASSAFDEETNEMGILGSSSVKSIDDDLKDLLGSIVDTDGSITSMYDLGMTLDEIETNIDEDGNTTYSGPLTVDETTLDEAISSNFSDIMAFFLGDEDNEITGFADLLNDKMRDMISYSGLIETEKDAAQDNVDRLEINIENATTRLDKRYKMLTSQFVELDKNINMLQAQGDLMNSMFDSFEATFKKD